MCIRNLGFTDIIMKPNDNRTTTSPLNEVTGRLVHKLLEWISAIKRNPFRLALLPYKSNFSRDVINVLTSSRRITGMILSG